jgi:hypothetical protein
MTDPHLARSFLLGEVAELETFGFVAVAPGGRPVHVIEITKSEDGSLDVRVPGRPTGISALSNEVVTALQERGFDSALPADATKPWTKSASDADEAVGLLQELFVEVFGEKPDAALDVAHGSHEMEYEAQRKLTLARERIETIINDVLGHPAERDEDGDYVLPIGDVHIMVAPRAAPDGQIIIRIFAITNVGLAVTPELGLFLARLNFGLMFGRFALDAEHNSIWFDETLLGEHFREEELRFAIRVVSSTADHWDDRLKQMFGGATHQEVVAGNADAVEPQTKPGEGVGLYL